MPSSGVSERASRTAARSAPNSTGPIPRPDAATSTSPTASSLERLLAEPLASPARHGPVAGQDRAVGRGGNGARAVLGTARQITSGAAEVVGEEAPCASRQPVSPRVIASITSPSLDFTTASWPSRTCLAVRASAWPKAAAMTSFRVAGGRAGQPLGGGVRAAPRLALAAAPAGHGNHIVRPTGIRAAS